MRALLEISKTVFVFYIYCLGAVAVFVAGKIREFIVAMLQLIKLVCHNLLKVSFQGIKAFGGIVLGILAVFMITAVGIFAVAREWLKK